MKEQIGAGVAAVISAVLTLVGAISLRVFGRRETLADRQAAGDASVQVREIDHTERLIEVLRAEMARLQERVDRLEQEREAWRAERVALEAERVELTARVGHLEEKLAAAGIQP